MSWNDRPDIVAWLERRSMAFVKATQKKGMPMSYGTGKPQEKKK